VDSEDAGRAVSGVDGGGSRARVLVGYVLFGLVVLFLLMDGGGKVLRLEPFVDGTTELGFHDGQVRLIGGLLLAILALYVVPRTAVLGAVLLTGYLARYLGWMGGGSSGPGGRSGRAAERGGIGRRTAPPAAPRPLQVSRAGRRAVEAESASRSTARIAGTSPGARPRV
jgi:hypothetical protein